jgi:hypothetical protein
VELAFVYALHSPSNIGRKVNNKFAKHVESLVPKLEDLLAITPCRDAQLPKVMPMCGVYLFSEGRKHLYVGRSNNIRARYGLHSRPSAPHNQASFAFLLAREETGILRPTYKTKGGRVWLMKQPKFLKAFKSAKVRMRKMDFRYVEESDHNRQALLEIYAAIALSARYNDFKTH